MINTYCFVCVFLLITVSSAVGQGFRTHPWGSSKKTVLAKETLKPEDDNEFSPSLLYRGVTVSGDLYADALYRFDKSLHLVSGVYWFQDRLSEQDWNRLMRVLSEKYGKITQVSKSTKTKVYFEYHWQNNDTHVMALSETINRVYDRNIIYYSVQEWNRIKMEERMKIKNKPNSEKQGL